jgi:type I restriction enzyme, S subunit
MRAVSVEGGGVVQPETRPYGEVQKGYTAFLPGDIIMAKITPCMENGKLAVVPGALSSPCFGSTEFHVMRPEKGIEATWISYYLLTHKTRRLAQRAMSGAVGQMRVPTAFLESLRIPVPPSAEQKRILDRVAELLSDLDAAVEALHAACTKLELYRASILKAAADGSLTVQWRNRNPNAKHASELLELILLERRKRWEQQQRALFKSKGVTPPGGWSSKYREPIPPDVAGLPSIPGGWCWASLDQIASIAGGVTKGPKKSSAATRSVPYLRVANVQRGFLDLTEMKHINASEDDIAALRLEPGDVLFNEGGDRDKLGRGWIWQGELDECIHQNHVFRVRLIWPGTQPKLVSWFGNSYGQEWFLREGKQSVNLASINMTNLRSFPVPLAPIAEQEAIVDAIEDQFSIVDHMDRDLADKLIESQSLRQAILHRAFSGRLVSQAPGDEPATTLLARIAIERETRKRDVVHARRANKERRIAATAKVSRLKRSRKGLRNGRIADR